MDVDEISISQFKATCLAALARVKRTGQPLLITRHGEPIAEVVPPSAGRPTRQWLGARRSTGKIVGDLIEPAVGAGAWESLDR